MTDRRKFLLGLGILGSAGAIGFNPIRRLLQGILRDAGEFSGLKLQESRNYVQINMYGSPSRWFFDNILKPSDSDLLYKHPMIYNRLIKSDPLAFDYSLTKIGGINFPSIWKHSVPMPGGKVRAMADLSEHMLTVRGIHLEGTQGHPLNCAKMVAPSLGGLSIDGLIADSSRNPIPAINIGNTPVTRAFKAKNNSVVNILSNEKNYLNFLLSPFVSDSANLDDEIDLATTEALEILKEIKKSSSPHLKPLYSDLAKAKKYFRNSIEGLLSEYDQLVKKYQSLLTRSLKVPLAGMSDKKISGLKLPFKAKGELGVRQGLAPFLANGIFLADDDLRLILQTASFGTMAQEFALAEYVITKGISSSIVISPENEMGKIFKNLNSGKSFSFGDISRKYLKESNETIFSKGEGKSAMARPLDLSLDSHETGSIINFATCPHYYFGLSSCLMELIESFKKTPLAKGNLFDETIVHLTAEFERLPNYHLDGSGHNENAHISSLFSGLFKKHRVLGNIFTGLPDGEADDQDAIGTVGFSAPVPSFNNQQIGISSLSHSISKLLRVPPIVGRADPIFDLVNGKFVSLIEDGKNIPGDPLKHEVN
ncbi:MAG: hypothetical protein HN509_08955 [Halobacteriovoraceae bacterium]|jgi:hypothetical protein|nr:hypothetical protein [Halobacteriovoraceae bacterium]MBT5095933.1 hypothetical protein [Halobacteriovoraceae bacterium]